MDRSDQQLINCYLKGDENSLEVLIKRYLKPVYSFIFRFVGDSQEAEDITQEVFVRVWRNLKNFDPRRSRFATLRGKKNKKPAPYRTEGSGAGFKTWIFAIAKNACLDWHKKKKNLPLYFAETIKDPSPVFNESLERILERLPSKYRMVLFLRYNDHFTFREIAESLGESINTVKTRHRRGIAILRKLLKTE